MPRANRQKSLGEMAAPLGASEGPVDLGGMEMPESEGPAPREMGEPEGEAAQQGSILQALSTPQPGPGAMAQPHGQMTPEEEEMLKAQLALAARQSLMGGGGIG